MLKDLLFIDVELTLENIIRLGDIVWKRFNNVAKDYYKQKAQCHNIVRRLLGPEKLSAFWIFTLEFMTELKKPMMNFAYARMLYMHMIQEAIGYFDWQNNLCSIFRGSNIYSILTIVVSFFFFLFLVFLFVVF